MLQSSTLRPGFLVSLKTTIAGNVSYEKRDIEGAHITSSGTQLARWETERTISDPIEHEAAKRARSKARSLITGICAASAFGLLCPETKIAELERAISEARKVAEEFNGAADLTRVTVYVITGRIAPNDVEAVRAINSELRDLIGEMEAGVKNVDVKAVREAASKARQLAAMLSPEAAGRVQEAVDTARRVARKYTAAGEAAANEIDSLAIASLIRARTSFLDMDEAGTVGSVQADARAVDFDPTETTGPIVSTSPRAPAIEI